MEEILKDIHSYNCMYHLIHLLYNGTSEQIRDAYNKMYVNKPIHSIRENKNETMSDVQMAETYRK